MMKWRVVRNPRSASADRSLECLKNDVQTRPALRNDSNNNVDTGGSSTPPPVKETNRLRDSSLNGKSSAVPTDCLNLKSFLGLSRQRSETNLSSLGLNNTGPRRSRSEVRGLSCDRLAIGYHTNPAAPSGNGKTRSSSPPSRSGCWIRGRKRERESRSAVKNNPDVLGKTIVTDSRRTTSSKKQNGESRTIVDGSDGKHNASAKSSLELRKGRGGKRGGEEDIIEEEVIYSEIEHDNGRGKLLEGNKETFKNTKHVSRKKGLAPKPQIAIALFKETSGMEVNLNPNGQCESPNPLSELSRVAPDCKPQRRNQTYNGRNPERRTENRVTHSVKLNNLKNNEKALVKTQNNINAQSLVAVAEIHKESLNNANKNVAECVRNTETGISHDLLPNDEKSADELMRTEEEKDPPAYHIDTPDYSTLDSVNCCSFVSTEEMYTTREDVCNTDCGEISTQESAVIVTSENEKSVRELSLSSILRDSSIENKGSDLEPKKTVRFEKLDLIEKYKKNKTDSLMDTEDDVDTSVCESKQPLLQSTLDVNCNEMISSVTQSLSEDFSENINNESPSEANCPGGMTVNVFVRSQSPAPNELQDTQSLVSPTQLVVKKSFVITVAKQERGFRSLCANKKPSEQVKNGQQISVTFLCSGPPSETWVQADQEECFKKQRSISVPPRNLQLQPPEVLPLLRGRSRERRSKERTHCKKNHKTKKKEPVFVMPQAVIDELSQVLEKRNPFPG